MSDARRLSAIVVADVVGYSRMMGRDESHTLAALKALRASHVDPLVAGNAGRVVKSMGDGLLIEFASIVLAVDFAARLQSALARSPVETGAGDRLVLRIGVHQGDVIVDGDDIFGDGVNVAARLQTVAPPGGMCVSQRTFEDVRNRLELIFVDGGTRALKNIAQPLQVWLWHPDGASGIATAGAGSAAAPTAAPVTEARAQPTSYRFDRFELLPVERVLRANGATAKLGGRAFDMLVALVERHERVVSKRELMDLVWPHLVVDESNLQAQMVALRKLLGPATIATVPGRGYRFTLPVEHSGAKPAASEGAHDDAVQAPMRHNLPLDLAPLIGRDRELAEVEALAAAHRLVTITGTGGVGKSRVATEVGRRCLARSPDGAWLVELAALSDAGLVPSAVCGALRVVVPPDADPLAELVLKLAARRMLLILDNCEHVVDAVAALVGRLLAAVPGVTVLASSQEPLGIPGEQVYRLPSLEVPVGATPTADEALACGASRLFAERACEAQAGFRLDDTSAPVVAEICRRLDGIPLAIEMAAARVPLLGVTALAQRLDERFRVLTAGRRTALPRQRTLQATLDWSYGLLGEEEKSVLRRLGVFRGSFSLEAAVAVAADGGADEFAVIERLAGLCDRSLLRASTSGGAPRYSMLETTAAYAQERLAEAGETAATARRHAAWYRKSAARCLDDWTTLSDRAFTERYAREVDNLRAAIGWALGEGGDDETAIALVGSSALAWTYLSLGAEIESLLEQAILRVTPSTPPALEAELSYAVGVLYAGRHLQRTVAAARRAVELWRALGERTRLGCALHVLGSAYAQRVEGEAESILREAQPLLEESGSARLQAMPHSALALFHAARGQSLEATREARVALDLQRAAGAEGNVLSTLGSLADQMWAQGELDRAVDAAREVIELHRRSPFSGRLARTYATANLFGMLVERGDLDAARAIGREVLPQLDELGILRGWSDHYASCLARSGRGADAVRLIGWSDATRAERKLTRQPNEQRARDATLAIVRERESALDVDRALAEGSAMTGAQAYRLATP